MISSNFIRDNSSSDSMAMLKQFEMDYATGCCKPKEISRLTDIFQPLDVDCSVTYSLDMNLFVGDANQPALILPEQLEWMDECRSSPWVEQLTWEQREIVDIIGIDIFFCSWEFTILILTNSM